MASKYTAIVCSGAGVAGGIFAGGIKKLQELRLVDEVDTYIGTSAGSFVATMLSLGYTPDECQEKLLNYDISSTFQLDPLHFFNGYGLSSANGVMSLIYYLLGDDPGIKAVGLRFLHPTSGNPTGVIDYFSRIQSTMTTHETPDENPNHSVIPLNTTISATDFKVTKEELQALFQAGYDTVEDYYRTIKGALPREIGETFLSF